MMQLLAALTSLLVTTSCIKALPTEALPKREVGGVLICRGANATGLCSYQTYVLETCQDLPADLSRDAATFAPDGDGFYCFPRAGSCEETCTSPTGCTFGAVDFYNPVKYDLSSVRWQNLIGSFDCHLNETSPAK